MWAHYADRHTGLVLCFDEQHTFFHRRRTENDEFYFVRKVRYSDDPPVSLATIDGDALLITKGTEWSYEKEWRMLVPLKDATRSMTIAGDTVHLFALPPDVLRGALPQKSEIASWIGSVPQRGSVGSDVVMQIP